MNIGIIISSDEWNIASRYKYNTFFSKVLENVSIYKEEFIDKYYKTIKIKPDLFIVYGSYRNGYKIALKNNLPYVLCEQDVVSMYHPGIKIHPKTKMQEIEKIKNAEKIIFTSPEHQKYIIEEYDFPIEKTMVLYPRPLLDDLKFDPLPKLEDKNLVYIGRLIEDDYAKSIPDFNYRYYIEIFKELIKSNWNIHIYPVGRPLKEYQEIGCIYHQFITEGKKFYRELSQYNAGIQGFATGKGFEYAKTCRPNKIWNYLAAGIPTIGINPGNGIELFEGKWGYELKEGNSINDLDFSKLNIEKYRAEEIIENQTEELLKFIYN